MTVIALLMASLLSWTVPELPPQKRPIFVTASFLGKTRMFLEDVSRDEVRVLENGRPRTIEFFSGPEVPTVYGLLFDRAILPQPSEEQLPNPNDIPASMAASSVAYQLIDQGLGRQVGWAGAYDKELHVAIDFTQDAGRIKDTIQRLRAERSIEDSSLSHALFAAVSKMSSRNEKRRVLILFLGALDIEAAARLKPMKNLLAASNIELFVAGFATSRFGDGRGLPPAQSEACLRELASVTAGGAYFIASEGIAGLGRRISNQIKTLYTIGFEAESPADKPASLKIECTRPVAKVTHHPVIPNLQ
jgi:hypothetical protein